MALFPLGITVELLVNGTWADATADCLQRDAITISGGRTARSDSSQPAQVTLTFRNGDGKYSPNNASSPYYPYLKRNVQLRVTAAGTSASGNTYSGFRGWFEIAAWPPQSDVSGNDVFVQVTGSGPLRRILKGGGRGSALTRYYASLTGALAPVDYWPCEQDPDATVIGAGIDGGTDMSVVSGTPKWKTGSFNGSAPVGMLNGSTWEGVTGAFGTSGDDKFIVPGTYTWTASTTTVDVRVWSGGGGGADGYHYNSYGGAAGGGSGTAHNASVAVTPGQQYTVTVGAGGSRGLHTAGGNDGGRSSFTGDAVTVTANPGRGAGGSGSPGGTGGTAGTGGYAGGDGGYILPGSHYNAGAGGAGSAGISGYGGFGDPNLVGGAGPYFGGFGGTGGGAAGGQGGVAGPHGKGVDGGDGHRPGGGGAGGWANATTYSKGGNGGPGQVELVYSASTGGSGPGPSNNVVRFLMAAPSWGGNANKVLLRVLTDGTVARLDVVFDSDPQKLVIKGYSSSSTLLFSGGMTSTVGGKTLLVSAELAANGTGVDWRLAMIRPKGNDDFDSVKNTRASAAMGNVTAVIVAPNGDITKTAVGHISVQYAFQGLAKVSAALGGHETELGVDRFTRLAGEQALDSAVEFSELADHWSFEDATTQGWTGVNGAVTCSTVTHSPSPGVQDWPSRGTYSLLLTAAGAAGTWSAHAPGGTSGQPVLPGDVVSAAADVYAPAALSAIQGTITWYDTGGTPISTTSGAAQALAAGQVATLAAGVGDGSIAPAGAAFFAAGVTAAGTVAAGTLLYIDHVRVHPQMGAQTRKEYHQFLEEIETLDQGIMKEAKELWGMKYRTRIALTNQAVAVTLGYGSLSPPLEPVLDDKFTKNDITVKREKGSQVRVTLPAGDPMSVEEPPAGTGRYRKTLKAVAVADEQLAALAAHLLALGTVSDERYPAVTISMARCGIPGDPLAPLMSAIASAEIGDRIQVTGLPGWMPSSSIDQMIIGYNEVISPYSWTIQWNCIPYAPLITVTSSLRRW